MDEFKHIPVLLSEVIDGLELRPDGCYIDCTFGRGGHSRAILERLDENGRLFIFDKDISSINHARQSFTTDDRVISHHGSFTGISRHIAEYNYTGRVDGILLDLGVSSPQLDDPSRGFSFLKEGNLDMRMDVSTGISAIDWVNTASRDEISKILFKYGEEKFARRIAREIINTRESVKIESTTQLSDIVCKAVPKKEKDTPPATRTFQAIRIYINNELQELEQVLPQALDLLNHEGRLLVISFHSLEDRIVKRFMRTAAQGDQFPHDIPVTAAQIKPRLKLVGKPVRPGEKEIQMNPRARSAVLRIAKKIN